MSPTCSSYTLFYLSHLFICLVVAAARIRNNLPKHVTFATIDVCLPVTSQGSPFYYFLSQFLTMYSAHAVTMTSVLLGTLIVQFSYLLTYPKSPKVSTVTDLIHVTS